ncbi:hypothetical protein E8E15_008130 [Penicillium rubens]|nr:hypothetical protein E8E15_008130 [Penicillium rubens]
MNATDPADYLWGPPTSKANYCETDYAVSRYVAEFINSLTNVVYIIYGTYGLRQLRRKDKYNDCLRALPYWGLIAVGLCSFAFHLSLKYHTQMTIFNLGYWLWILDQWACGFLAKSREAIGLPWAFVLELHGWWHICTGIGAYIFIAVVDHLVSGEDLSQQSLAWPASWASTSIFAGRGPVDKVSEKQK